MTKYPIIGAHMSAAGGPHKAVERAAEVTADCCQLFLTPPRRWPQLVHLLTKNNNQWRAAPLTESGIEALKAAKRKYRIRDVIAHSSYLINLATPDAALWNKSIDAFVVELQRAERLDIPLVVLHPGAYTTSSEKRGVRRVVRALNEVHRQTRGIRAQCLLENTAGQGTCLGWHFEHLAAILDAVKEPDRLGVCFDTCHAFAAGYPMADKTDYLATMRQLDRLVGIRRVKAIHLNDSKRELGSRVDRHEHIGRGKLGVKAFTHLMNDRRLRRIPMYLETPKGDDPKSGKPWDVVNLRRLRRLIAKRDRASAAPGR